MHSHNLIQANDMICPSGQSPWVEALGPVVFKSQPTFPLSFFYSSLTQRITRDHRS